jgi:S-DNA-T family DNA segregation ATPase FtsK/SpoIIIE
MRTTRTFDTPLLDTNLLKTMMRRQAATLSGLALIAVAALAVLALATWSVSDPSLSHATAAPVTNMLGAAGAIFADLIMQVLGLGAVFLLVPIVIWGWHLMTYGGLEAKARRTAFALGFAAACCALLALMPLSGAWPLPIGLGGLIGDALIALPHGLIPVSIVPSLVVAALALPAAYVCFRRATAVPVLPTPPSPADMRIEPRRVHRADGVEEEYWDDEDEDGFEDEDRPGRMQLAMGHATHLGYSGLAAVKRLLPGSRRAYPPVRPDLGTLNARLRASEDPEFARQEPAYADEPTQDTAWDQPELPPIAADPQMAYAPQPARKPRRCHRMSGPSLNPRRRMKRPSRSICSRSTAKTRPPGPINHNRQTTSMLRNRRRPVVLPRAAPGPVVTRALLKSPNRSPANAPPAKRNPR